MPLVAFRRGRRYVFVGSSGIGFYYKGDEVIWLWPWRRSYWRRPWLSIGFGVSFRTLRQLDRAWEDYARASLPADY